MSQRNYRTILPLLWGFAFLSYLLRVNMSVAQQYLAHEFQMSDQQVGYLFTAFLVGYTVFQVPAGALGDRFGPRLVLAVAGLLWGLTTLLTGLAPKLLLNSSIAALGSLCLIRFAHGLEEAATFPVAMSAVSLWFPSARHALVNAVIFTGSTLGSACAPPFVALLMNRYGWRSSFYIAAIFPVVLALVWWRAGKQPASMVPHAPKSAPKHSFRSWVWLLKQRSIAALCLSYLLYCYAISIFVYWLFKYLVDVRHLSIVGSGWANSLPWLVASVAVPLLGYASTKASQRIGLLAGRRLVASTCLIVAALLMAVGARAESVTVALAAISVCVGLLFSTESSYWSTAIELANENAGAASGLMNLAGNLGGVLTTLLVPIIVVHFGWPSALLSGSLLAVLGAATWFLIQA